MEKKTNSRTIKFRTIKLQTIDLEIILNFIFLKKGLGVVSPPHFIYISKKVFLMLYSIN